MLVAGTTWVLTYRRNLRRVIEQPDIAPADRTRPASRFASAIAAKLLRKPLDRAIVLFTARTLGRSRQHRLLLAVYGGIALAISLAYTKEFIYGTTKEHWWQVNVPFLVAALVPTILALVGSRAVFALPLTLPANWIFRITAVHSPAAYFAAVRKSLLAVAVVPILTVAAGIYLTIWPVRPAMQHLSILVLTGSLLMFWLLRTFRKIPFACSYLPGKSNLKIKLGAFAILFLLAVDIGARMEYWAIQRPVRFGVLIGILLVAILWARWRAVEFAESPNNRIQFEDVPDKEIYALDLRGDGASLNDEAYARAIGTPP